MPIEVRELVIRAVVEPEPKKEQAAAPAKDKKGMKQHLIAESVAQTLAALERQRER